MAAPPPTGPLPDLADNMQTQVYVACCICLPVALMTLVLRFVARHLTKAKLWWDDWLVLVAMLGDIGFFISTMILLANGMGKHYETDSMEQYTNFAKTYIPAACMYAVGIANTKMSLLFFYRRIFSAVPSIRPYIWILGFLVYGWMISVIFVSIFSCTPVAFWWDKTIPNGTCVDNTKFLLGNSIPNICTDFFILALPLPYIWNLKQSLGRKLVISGMFLLGGFVCVITIIRLVIQVHTDFASLDLTWNITDFVTWTNVEVSLAIVSACLPSLRPVITWLRNGGSMPPSSTKAYSEGASYGSSNGRWSRFRNHGHHSKLSNASNTDSNRDWRAPNMEMGPRAVKIPIAPAGSDRCPVHGPDRDHCPVHGRQTVQGHCPVHSDTNVALPVQIPSPPVQTPVTPQPQTIHLQREVTVADSGPNPQYEYHAR